jgi:hypothetical protein
VNEIKKDTKLGKVMNTTDMLTHPWILVTEQEGPKGSGKIKGSFTGDNAMKVKLSLKELLNVSSDWKEVNKKNPTNGGQPLGGGLPMDFQSQ